MKKVYCIFETDGGHSDLVDYIYSNKSKAEKALMKLEKEKDAFTDGYYIQEWELK